MPVQTASLGSVGSKRLLGLVGDGFEVADEGGAVGVVLEEGLEARVGADAAVAVGEELRQVFLEVRRGHGVEIGESVIVHTATSSMPAGWADCVRAGGGVRGA